ncbi:protein kinase domain-containing protein [Streptomyces coffeae]|uniref:PQQ-binding-like beta-propeller repeat protein n=1 Tax=Streptomyces coffeae TaxID=621382 RepID=A0ABS1NNN8_9ACTN|nr:serine/threonine-protein kinase [Streptomyces coffeae]MBL1101702.1 PQQ-binding-like beta-propeller repeat protein [Streptomyces coffeae]
MSPVHRPGAGPDVEDPEFAGQYRLETRLGSGGMGVVHLARSTSGRRLAVKVVHAEYAQDPEFRARFRQEVAAARRVSGAFTAPVVDADPDDPRPWMATQYIPAPTLAEEVKRNGPLVAGEVVRLASGLAEALRDIHRAGVVHRDLKPSNVLLAADGPKVIDFGISRPADSELRTETGQLIGTPPFMAPEQFQRPRTVGPAADVFALGSVLVHAATGRGPFESESPYLVAYQVVHDEADLAGVPDELLPLVERCLAKDPRERPTPDALMTVLRAVGGPLPPLSCAAVPLVPAPRTPDPVSLPGRGSAAARDRRPEDGGVDPGATGQDHGDGTGAATGDTDTHVKEAAPGSRPVRRRRVRRWVTAGLTAAVLLAAGTVVALRHFDRPSPETEAGGTQNSAATSTPWRPWRATLGGGKPTGTGTARPAFCSYGDGALYCAGRGVGAARLDPGNGRVEWSRPAAGSASGDEVPTAPVLSGGLLRVVSPDGTRLEALDPATHRVRWSRDVSGYGGRVHPAGDTVLLVAADGTVRAVDGTTNRERWHHRLSGHTLPSFFAYGDGRTAYAVTSSPDGSRTLVTAVDTERGATRWRHTFTGHLIPAGAGPRGALLLTETDAQSRTTAVVRYEPGRGGVHRVPLTSPVSATSAVAEGGTGYLLCADGGLLAVNTGRGKRGWRLETSVANASRLVATDGRLYFSAADGRLLAVDAERGTLLGQTEPRAGRAGQRYLELVPAPVAADGKVFATAPDGTVFGVDGRNPANW